MYGEYGAVTMISVVAYGEWTSRWEEPPPEDAAPVVYIVANVLVRGVQQTMNTRRHAPVDRYLRVQFLENEIVREYVHQNGSDHRCYVWRYTQPQQGYPWYRERGWDEEWREGTQGDDVVSNVNDQGTQTPEDWTTHEGIQFGYIGAEGLVSALTEDCWSAAALAED